MNWNASKQRRWKQFPVSSTFEVFLLFLFSNVFGLVSLGWCMIDGVGAELFYFQRLCFRKAILGGDGDGSVSLLGNIAFVVSVGIATCPPYTW